ncbi:50S ribosomal protein L24P [Candidatus Methanoplasma termitum]|uniref:Large ribosomal subunit protein uL24 n=1 Tax=Candidatus Methanoplasma termitum TaxID=1577791 RepID=A0A0A7LCA4_9ARCH|nr:50S ribosomal protein L24 [Candidatus Methanoplasma termitum]AIZ56825.1 50S ribosomal protein L24P [Candidatus Methanoplasma termitum]MCL2334291.1 50S ribosomal protein L24 [Candidatus Methanoplasma sp.]
MASSKARVQRKTQANAPLHVKRKMLSAHLSNELRSQYGVRTARVCKGDTVAIIRGDEDVRGTEAKVLEVFVNTGRVSVEGVTINQADGTAIVRPIHASNLIITKLNTEDQWRIDSLSKKKEAEQ